MKVIVAAFQCESNSKSIIHPKKEDFEFFQDEKIFKKIVVKEELMKNNFEVIPSIYAVALPSGTLEKDLYFYYEKKIIETVKENTDVDGIYIFFHGSMEVNEIGSGELYLVKEIRKFVSNKCIIAVSLDAHANLYEEFSDYVDIICGFKTIPHTDQKECQLRAVRALIYCLKNGLKPISKIQRVPFLLKNDTLLTGEEPLKALINETKKLEEKEEILTANLFLGHCWIDAPNTCSTTVVSALNQQTAIKVSKYLANKLWETRKDYKFKIEAESALECVKRAINGKENRIFITDSGDNTTAGAEGESLEMLKLFLNQKTLKKVCVAGITNNDIVKKMWEKQDGEIVKISILNDKTATIKSHGQILGWTKEIIGKSLTLSFKNVDAIFTEYRSAFIEKGNFDKAKVNLLDYQIVIVKLGYLFTELKQYANRELFALTDGTSCVELERLKLKKIKRPMYPLDEFEWKA